MSMNDLMGRLDGLVRFANDLEFRMSDSGFTGVMGVAEQVRRIRQALDRVQFDELSWARAEVQGLIAQLNDVARGLDELNEAKGIFGPGSPQQHASTQVGDGYLNNS